MGVRTVASVLVDSGGGGGGGEFDVDTWVPGKPDKLDDLSVRLRSFGTEVSLVALGVTTTREAIESTSWSGDAATNFVAKLGALPERLYAISEAYASVGVSVGNLAARARELRAEARRAIDALIDARTAESAAETALDKAAGDWLSGLFTGDASALHDDLVRAQNELDAARDTASGLISDLRLIARDYHDACAECALAIDAAEPERLLDRDFLSLLIEAQTDARLGVVIDSWNVPLTTDLDDPELDGDGEYEDRTGEPLFPNGVPRPDDVDQGDLGDCWLLAVLAGMAAQNPDAIERMIRENPDGTYTVTFADGRAVTVDADVRDSGGHGLWVSIIEKAYAQREGGYDELNGGDPSNALKALLGGDTEDFDPDSTRDFIFGDNVSPADSYRRIEQALDDGRVVTASVRNTLGINGGHALTVTDVYESGGEQYVVVRNPWGDHGQMAQHIEAAGGTLRSGGYFVMPVGAFADHFYKVRMQK